MELYFPSYLNRKPGPLKERERGYSEGTRVTWKIDTETTEKTWVDSELNFAFSERRKCLYII
jgi:hypothetical protein